jgi:hypothetical protein
VYALEQAHATIKEYLKFYVSAEKDDWDEFLDRAVFSYNNAVHSATLYTPFKLMFGSKVVVTSSRNAGVDAPST